MPLEEFESFDCPYCGQSNPLYIDITGGSHQRFVVDCEVCCAPIAVHIQLRGGEIISIETRRENE